jgi:integrase
VRAWHSKLAKEHSTTAAKAYRLLAVIMKTAVADRLILTSPCQVKGAATETAPERPIATEDEVEAIAGAMPERLRIAPLLAAWCQLRLAEVLGLRRRDVDLNAGTVSVAETLTKGMNGTMIEKAPKTAAGRRTVPVPSNVLPALKHHLETFVDQEPTARLLADAYRPLRTAWDNARTKVGRTDGLRFHDLRHSGLTWAAAEGATTAELMHRAGHKSSAAAMKYQHATVERDREIADKLAARVAKSQCGSCSAPLPDGAIFCSQCGTKVEA